MDGDVELACDATNTGDRSGFAVVQVYCTSPPAAGHPPQQLKAVRKARLDAHETARLRLSVTMSALAAYDTVNDRFSIADGTYGLCLAWSSRSPLWSGATQVDGGLFSHAAADVVPPREPRSVVDNGDAKQP